MTFAYPKIGVLLGDKYLIESVIGKGATANVYKVKHKYLQIEMAIKVLSPELVNKDKKAEDMFFDEASNLAKMNHPNLIRIWDAERIGGYSCIAMEIINGINLENIIKEKITLEPLRAIKIIIECCKALQHSYEHGLVHRDIKPGNIMVIGDHGVKIIDFGLSKKIGQPVKFQIIGGPMCGTLYYMAPEQLTDSDRVDHRADIYGIGCTLYHMLIGKVPFQTDDLSQLILMHMSTEPEVLSQVNSKITQKLSNVVLKTLEKNPLKRYQDYYGLIKDLENCLRDYDKNLDSSLATKEAEQMNSLLFNDQSFILSNLKDKYQKKAKDKNSEPEQNLDTNTNSLQQKFIKNIKTDPTINSSKTY